VAFIGGIVARPGTRGASRFAAAAIIPPLMEAERLNALAAKLDDLHQRSAELRRYL
jgi:hypothetical protein